MRILWSSNAMWAQSGYGIQAKYILPQLQSAGHTVAQHAWWGLQGGTLNLGGITIFPMGFDQYGNDIVDAHAQHFKADVVISLMDVWVLHEYGKKDMRWIPYMPIDMDPVPEKVVKSLDGAYRVVSYAKWGKQMLDGIGIENTYIPHGVDCKIFAPQDKAEAKRKMNLDPDAFVIGMVAANKGIPSRKAFPENLQAVANWKREHPERKVHLYLHTWEGPQMAGYDLNKLLQHLGFDADDVTFCNQYKYLCGMLDDQYMATAYNAMDVLLSATMSEGFGIPIIEAQACGTPVITTHCTSMPELTYVGWAVPYAQKFWTPLNAWIYFPEVDAITDALEQAFKVRGNETRRQIAATTIRAEYDWDLIVQKHWLPFLADVAAQIENEGGNG